MGYEITSTLKLDHCWICVCSEIKKHEHHVVPRNSGGADGPTVTLCSGHHNDIHDAALGCYPMVDNPKMSKWLTNLTTEGSRERFIYLVNVIIKARLLTIKDKNKSRYVSAKLSPTDASRFDRIAATLSEGNKPLTQEEVIVYAIRDLYSRLGL